MNPFYYINISVSVFCVFVCLIILICVATAEDRKEKLNRIFLWVVVCGIGSLLVSVTKLVFEGNLNAFYITRVAYFFGAFLGPLMLIAFTNYIVTFISKKTSISKAIRIIAFIAIASSVANIVTELSGIYFFIDENNIYHRSEWIWLSDVYSGISFLLNISIIITHQKRLDKRERIFLLSYAILPSLAMAVNIIYAGKIGVINWAIILTIMLYYAGIQNEQSKQLKQKELELMESRIDIMLSQIQPHFLYNTLATIEAFCNQDGSKTSAKMVRDFSNYLRENMDSLTQKEPVSFSRELEHIRIYLDIEKMRFEDRLTVVYDLKVTDFPLPILTLQPLVENAVRYGLSKKRFGGTVTISTCLIHEGVKITVADNGSGFDPAQSKTPDGRSHVGIENVRERLRTQCGGTLTIESEEGKGTVCTIMIPRKADKT